MRIIFRHILPNTSHILLVQASIAFVSAIKAEVILSFLGIGIRDGMSWGLMIEESTKEVLAGFYNNFIAASLLMFGLVGFLMMRGGKGAAASALASLVAGGVTMAVIAKIFSASRKLASDGTIHPADAVGCTGSVYLEIRPGSIGKVQVEVKGALKVFDARARDPKAKIATGERVKVAEAADMLIVDPA